MARKETPGDERWTDADGFAAAFGKAEPHTIDDFTYLTTIRDEAQREADGADESMTKLDDAVRDAMDAEEFAVPRIKALPLHDAYHIRMAHAALPVVKDITDAERGEALRRILDAADAHDVDLVKSTFAAPGGATTGLAGYDLEGANGDKAATRRTVAALAHGKKSKEDADYVARADTEPCRTCRHFEAMEACEIVRGKISPDGHCRFYAAMTKAHQPEPRPLAAGVALAAPEGHVLFLRRSGSGEWGLPGGKVEAGETPEAAMLRETREETSFAVPNGERREIVRIDGAVFTYVTFFQRVEDRFEPKLNREHDAHRWALPDNPPLPLHPGLRAAMPAIVAEVTQFTMKATSAMDTLSLFLPIAKADAKSRIVYGTAVIEAPDRSGEIFDYASSKPNFEAWSADIAKTTGGKSLGNVRSMHGKVAAGKLTDLTFDDKGKRIEVAAKIVDDDEWAKVEEGVYTGFSIGGRYARRWQDGELRRYTAVPSEISLVDLPCVKEATFSLVKADGSQETRAFRQTPPAASTVITNEAVAARATDMAKAAGNESEWASYIGEARKQMEIDAAAERSLAAKEAAEREAVAKRAAAPDESGPQPAPRVSADGDWEQVWRSPRLPGEFFPRKSDLQKRLLELDATESVAAKAAGILKTLDGAGAVAAEAFLDGGLLKREYSADERKKYASSGIAMRDGSFPIPDKAALSDAIHAYGRSKNKPAAKRHIIRRARALAATSMLPDGWGGNSKSEKYAKAALAGLTGADLEKGACLHFVADLLHLMAAVECLEDQCEVQANGMLSIGSIVNVPAAICDRFGTLLVEFGDIVADILDVVLTSVREEEAREAMEHAAPVIDLIKVGARHSKETLAVIQTVHDAMVNLAGETICKPPGKRVGDDASVDTSKPGDRAGGGGEDVARPGRRVGQDHPQGGVPSGIGDIAPYKDFGAEDLMKIAAERDAEIAALKAKGEASEQATKTLLDQIGEKITATVGGLEKTIADLRSENAQLAKRVDDRLDGVERGQRRAQIDLAAIRNQPAGFGTFRVAEKAADGVPGARLTRDATDSELTAAANETYLRRIMGPIPG